MTVPAIADGDPVRRIVCGTNYYDAPSDAARPLLWDEGGGKWSLSFDGVDDGVICPLTFSGDLEFLAELRWTASTDFRHTFVDHDQIPMIKMYSQYTYADGDFRIFDGVTSYRCVGSFPGFGDTGWQTVGLSRDSNALFGRVGGTDYTAGLTTGDSLVNPCIMGRPSGERTAGRIVGLATFSVRLPGSDRAALKSYLAALAP
jgi:hypothetical protein